ncbi:glycosyltransferase [Nakamurella leprariae]|uniref:Glycosyltransferase family 2 protein n=1 Tax=Nakamurella leprariae TaxID=2803911 RepID=A0A938Y5Q0_9ACTN|nr:glycosyltransferase family 2 protein [Nakamurella leprariae]MBM9466260.1 glycosyltransferase family 2 protein [Nakamurella leprariae]
MTIMLAPRRAGTTGGRAPSDDDLDARFADVVDGAVLASAPAGGFRASLQQVRAGAAKSWRSMFGRRSATKATLGRPRILALVPAHNEEADIARTIEGLLAQTRPIDRIVVILDNCTDGTEAIVRRYQGVTVQHTVGNIDKKVGALTQGWQQWALDHDFVLGVDADTVLAKDALEQLEAEMVRVPSAAGVMCRYTFDINLGTTFFARQLIRAQRMDFASWLTDIMARNRSTYVLGGQATLFRTKHLQQVTTDLERNSPWDPDAQVEDMELTWRLHEMGRKTLVSATARAYAGPMVTMKGLMGQRRKWDEGMAALLWRHKMPDKNTFIPWKQQFSMLANGLVRLLFLAMLIAALTVHQFTWSPIWLIPIAIGVALNVKIAWRVPDRRPADIVYALLVFPAELWLITRVWSTAVSWLNIWFGARRDGWAAQAAAEAGKGGGSGVIGKMLAVILLGGAAVAGATWWWVTQASVQVQETVLTTGWSVVTVMTLALTGFALIKLFKPTRGYRP